MHFKKAMSWKLAVFSLLGVSAQQPADPVVPPPNPPQPMSEIQAVSHRHVDPVPGLVAAARTSLSRVQDYTCTFIKQERIDGRLLAAQTAKMQVRSRPFSVHVEFLAPESAVGREAVYVETPGPKRLRVKDSGWKGALGFVTLNLDDRRVMAENRHTLDHAGIAALTELVARNYSDGSGQPPPEVRVADYQVGNQVCTRLELVSDPNDGNAYCHRCCVYFDKATHLPVRFEAYDRPTAESPQGELIELYSYSDVRFNVGLTDETFQK